MGHDRDVDPHLVDAIATQIRLRRRALERLPVGLRPDPRDHAWGDPAHEANVRASIPVESPRIDARTFVPP